MLPANWHRNVTLTLSQLATVPVHKQLLYTRWWHMQTRHSYTFWRKHSQFHLTIGKASLYRCSAGLRFIQDCQLRLLSTEREFCQHQSLASLSNYGGHYYHNGLLASRDALQSSIAYVPNSFTVRHKVRYYRLGDQSSATVIVANDQQSPKAP